MNRSLKTMLAAVLLAGSSLGAHAKTNSDWYGQAAISPNGKTIAFTYKGDIYSVPAKGGKAVALTVNAAWEGFPVWSNNGKILAFASARHGSLDVFVMPSEGGKAKRLTYHNAADRPFAFAPGDTAVTFGSSRTDDAKASLFPRGSLTELYNISVKGGTPSMVLTTPAEEARWNKDGSKLLYREEKALESDLRKHDTSAFARDIWMYDVKTGAHTQLTDFKGGDHNPVWGKRNKIFYTSEEADNTFNIWRMDLPSGSRQAVTNYKQHPVRSLSAAKGGLMAYIHNGSIYTVKDGNKPKLVKITISADGHGRDTETLSVTGHIDGFSVSPKSKEVAFVARGEVFVTSAEFRTTKRITNTPAQERSVDFAPDGKSLVYAAERGGKWKIVQSKIASKDEKYFFAATVIDETILFEGDKEAFQPMYSPDGKKVAFISNRDAVKVIDIESGVVTTPLPAKYNYSYADGDITFDWSTDSKWLTVDFAPRNRLFITNIAIVPADGSAEPRDISLSGYQDGTPSWHSGGNAVLWASSRYGQRDHGSWGTEFDVMAAFLTQDAFDKFSMSKEEYQLMKELKEDKKKEKEKAEKEKKKAEAENASKEDAKDADKKNADKGKKAEAAKAAKANDKDAKDKVKAVKIEWDGLADRTVRLTAHSSDLADAVLTKDGEKLYYLAAFEGGYDLWMHNLREDKTKLITKLDAGNASFELSDDEKNLFVLSAGSLSKFKLDGASASRKSVSVNASVELEATAERAYFFEHIWRQVQDKFYNPNMHGVDWDAMKANYAAKLPSIGNNRDFARMMEEMLGELNASHTGAYYRGKVDHADAAATLGLIFDLSDTSGALPIAEVLDKSPFRRASSNVKAGMTLSAIDDVKLDGSRNLYQLLNHKGGDRVRLTFTKADGTSFDEVIKPISRRAESQLMYERWVKNREALVEKLSGGRLGYVHIRAMNDRSYRQVFSNIFGKNFDKEAIVVDTRWNGGGWLHNDLAKLLSGKQYMRMKVRGRVYEGDPIDQWHKPSILVMGEGNYSDAAAFPFTYRALKIGEMVGMPVPGTMTAVWWETLHSGDITFGIPQVGILNNAGEYLENAQIEPDYLVKNDAASSAAGKDLQIEKAVEVMLKQLDAENSNP
jgi:tricorn protease